MLPIVQILDSNSNNLKLLATAQNLITKQAGNAGRGGIVDQNGGFNFGQILETIGSTVINEYLAPLGNPDVLRTASIFGARIYIATYANRTAQCRLAIPVACKAGKQISGFIWENFTTTMQGSGVTATLTITLKKMASDGTLTTIATYTRAFSATTSCSAGASGSPVTMDEGDKIVVEMQLATTTGTHNTTNYFYSMFDQVANTSILNIF